MKSKLSLLTAAVAALSVQSSASLASESTITDVLKEGKAYLNLRARYENVEVDNALKDANALTLKTIAGYESTDISGFKFLFEFENISDLQDEYAPSSAGFQVVADPESEGWNRAQISYQKDGFSAILGRQRIILDNARFVGNVGWRQNEQTFDAATLKYTMGNFDAFYSYIDQVNTILNGEIESESSLINVSYKTPVGKLSGFAYLLENPDTDATDDTVGFLFKGKQDLDSLSLLYSASFATQEVESGAGTAEADYIALELGAKVSGVVVAVGNETLGSDEGAYGFQTQLATKHAYNGWADKFLKTPDAGLSDTYVKVAGNVAGVKLVGFYHDYEADEGSADLGSEFNLVAVKKFSPKYTVLAKYADYSKGDRAGDLDTEKFWLQAEAKF